MATGDWSSDVCASDLARIPFHPAAPNTAQREEISFSQAWFDLVNFTLLFFGVCVCVEEGERGGGSVWKPPEHRPTVSVHLRGFPPHSGIVCSCKRVCACMGVCVCAFFFQTPSSPLFSFSTRILFLSPSLSPFLNPHPSSSESLLRPISRP